MRKLRTNYRKWFGLRWRRTPPEYRRKLTKSKRKKRKK